MAKASLSEIKKNIKSGALVLGTKRTIKNLKIGKVAKVLISSNCPESVEKSIRHYTKLSSAEPIKIDYSNKELGTICKKPFSISVLGILKG